jgi:nucleoside-diphosphate-sugar epimerase
VSIAELAAQVAAFGVPPVAIEIQGTPRENAARDHYLPDLTLVKETLGVRESVSLDEALARTMRWHRSRP